VDKATISRFLRNACTPEEELAVVQWLAAPHSKKELQEIIGRDLKRGLEGQSTAGVDLSRIRTNILAQNTATRKAQRTRRLWKFILKTAASLLLLAVSVFAIHIFLSKEKVPQQTEATPSRIIKTNQKGRKSTIFLPDGSTVNLNSESTISYPEGFSLARRVVHLEGEAFFDVAKDTDKPFVVKTRNLKIRALGTSFNVRAYEGTGEVRIALATGKVEVYERAPKTERPNDQTRHGVSPHADDTVAPNNRAILLPGQSVNFYSNSHIFGTIESFDPKEEYGWKEGIIYFRKAGLQEVISTLERWYNVRFLAVNEPPHRWSHNGEYQDMTLKQVLQQMAFTEGIEYNIHENHIRISFKQ
jgi:ferric-dicitrate binding protein FerR (iron transport regulator)